jgi:hypothetical protein
MTFTERINADIKSAMLAKEKEKLAGKLFENGDYLRTLEKIYQGYIRLENDQLVQC